MFENSNNSNSTIKQPVDDIFADTDQSPDNKASDSTNQVMTRHVGLGASSGSIAPTTDNNGLSEGEEKGGGKGFTIAVIIMAVVIIGLIGFLVYSKFFSNVNDVTENVEVTSEPTPSETITPTSSDPVVNTSDDKDSDAAFVEVLPSDISDASTTDDVEVDVTNLDSDNDGISDSEESILGTNPLIADTDVDDLSDYQEVMGYKTNPLLVDTDGDKLTDYEEVMIYKTNPLLVDTDGDTYGDGAEASSGYDPLLTGGALLTGDLRTYQPILYRE